MKTKKETEKVIEPFKMFKERVARTFYDLKGKAKGTETVTVLQMYNAQHIKVRVQCSSCERFRANRPGCWGDPERYCPGCLTADKKGELTVPDGRGLCKEYEMAEWCKLAGAKGKGKVLSGDYVRWFCTNYDNLLNNFRPLAMHGADWDTWHRSVYEMESGRTIYGDKIKKDDE